MEAIGGFMSLFITVSAPAISRFEALQLLEVGLNVCIFGRLMAAGTLGRSWWLVSSCHCMVGFNNYSLIFDLLADL